MKTKKSQQMSPDRKTIEVFNPATSEKIGEVPSFSLDEARAALQEVRAAQSGWAQTPIRRRVEIMHAFASILHARAHDVATLLAKENGKSFNEALLFDIIPVVRLADYYASHAKRILKNKRLSISLFKNRASYIHYQPRGVVFVISPWNFPLGIPAGEVVAALISGNGVLLKPASITPLISLKLRELMDEAGLDPQIFQVITGPGSMASKLIDTCSREIDYVNFTGSTEIGRSVAAQCGRHLIPCSMELGGTDPAIVCRDADIEQAARSVAWGAFANAGQVCASVERVYVHADIYDDFVKRLIDYTGTIRLGDPLAMSSECGAMTSEDQVKIVEEQIEDACSKGARIVTGGKRNPEGSMFFEPTVILDANHQMKVLSEESFGPLLPVLKVASEEEAISLANDSPYGLSAYVYTRNRAKGRSIAERLEAGTVMVNETLMTYALPETPWSGIKDSGMGRVHSDEGLRDLCRAAHVNYELIRIPRPLWKHFWLWYPYSRQKNALAMGILGQTIYNAPWRRCLRALLGKR